MVHDDLQINYTLGLTERDRVSAFARVHMNADLGFKTVLRLSLNFKHIL